MVNNAKVIRAVRSLNKDCHEGTFDLPEGMILKASNIKFSLEGCYKYYTTTDQKLERREIHLNIMSTATGRRNKKVGTVLLMEKPDNTGPDGIFSLHFIGVDKGHKGKSYGSTALDLTIMLAQRLAQHSSFYDRLTLQCADYDGDTHLGNMPYRLSYYLNHGFHIDAETVSYMRHLDLGHFIQSMGVEEFTSFLNSYSDGQWGTIAFPLATFTDRSEEILRTLKATNTPAPFALDKDSLERAESSSSDAGQRIIDRLFYDSTLDDEGYQTRCGEMIYLMHLDIGDWSQALEARRILKAERAAAEATLKHDPSELNRLLLQIAQVHSTLTRLPFAEIEASRDNIKKRTRSQTAEGKAEQERENILLDYDLPTSPRAYKRARPLLQEVAVKG